MIPLRRHVYIRLSSVALLAALTFLSVGGATGQTRSETPSALIRSLSIERRKGDPIIFSFRCGMINGPMWERRTARELVQLGRTAVPFIERAFDSIESKGWQSSLYENAGWLFFAYARILGPAAVPRLQRMAQNPKLTDERRTFDDALALSLGLTSYVSGWGGSPLSLGCRRELPRDALDGLVVSLALGDLVGLQRTLGPEAREALDRGLQTRSWEIIRQQMWRPRPGRHDAVGYRLEIQGPWSEPEETLEQPREEYHGPLLAAERFSLETQFTDSAGKDCARYKVDFLSVKAPPSLIQDIYRINNADIEDLLRFIGRCASE
jgi:hypothetical protein